MEAHTPSGTDSLTMSAPYSAAFSAGGAMGMPGSASLSSNGPNIPSLSWGNGATMLPGQAASFANFGISSGNNTTATHTSNDFIQQQMVIHPWNDGAHLNIAEFQIVCCNRSIADHNLNMYTAISLAKVNELTRDAYATYEAVTENAGDPELNDPDAMAFRDLLAKHGEDKLEAYHKLFKLHGSAMAQKYFEPMGGELARFYKHATTHPVLRYLTKLGILLQWNILGATVGVNRGTSLDERDAAAGTERISVINTIIAKRATVHNVFGDKQSLPTGADTYLVLRRVQRRGDRGPGRFEIIPYATRMRIGVPRHLAVYSDGWLDYTEKKPQFRRYVDSYVFPFGVVTQPASRDAPAGVREVAVGLNGNSRAAYESVSTLPTVHIQVCM